VLTAGYLICFNALRAVVISRGLSSVSATQNPRAHRAVSDLFPCIAAAGGMRGLFGFWTARGGAIPGNVAATSASRRLRTTLFGGASANAARAHISRAADDGLRGVPDGLFLPRHCSAQITPTAYQQHATTLRGESHLPPTALLVSSILFLLTT
jgi:hypothetical protein